MANLLVVTKANIEKGGARPANDIDAGIFILLQSGKNWGKGKDIPTLLLQHKKSGARCRVTAGSFFDYVKSSECLLPEEDRPFIESKTAYQIDPEKPFFFYAKEFKITVGPVSMMSKDIGTKPADTKPAEPVLDANGFPVK